jgi:phosphoesterase RecJ-like protein
MTTGAAGGRPATAATALDEVAQVLSGGHAFLLPLHEAPDGDTLGSTLALAICLERTGKSAVVASPDAVPPAYRFLPGSGAVRGWGDVGGGFDAAVFVDCGDMDRAGGGDVRPRCRVVVNIDHHPTNPRFGDINLVDPGAAAAGEIVAQILDRLGWPVDPAVATCLYVALMTDTGSFRYANTTAAALRLAARLVDAGASPYDIAGAVYENQPPAHIGLVGRALLSLRVSPSGRAAWMRLGREDFAAAGASEDDTEGVVNYARMVRGVEVGFLLREDARGGVRVSLRSRQTVDVGLLAAGLGGGGHPRAAGAHLHAITLDQAEALLLERVLAAVGDGAGDAAGDGAGDAPAGRRDGP